jgi:uroporphyrinogen-III decarboxylase
MTPHERLFRAFSGEAVDHVPFVPKIWVDLGAALTNTALRAVIADPLLAMQVIIDAGILVGADGVRQFIFPARKTEPAGEVLFEIDESGRRLGTIDIAGGLATHLFDASDFRLADPYFIAHQNFWNSREPFINDLSDVKKMVVPQKSYYEAAGYGAYQRQMMAYAGDRIALIGDCDTATLAFYAGFRGIEQALLDFYDNPQLIHAVMEKGAARSIERGKFNIDLGLRILRLNDSMGNMSLISPQHWREFIFPHMKTVCDDLHHYSPEVRIYCHICGDIMPIIELLAEAGLDCIAPLDPLGGFSVADARRAVGDKMILMGGIDTLSFINSTEDQIAAEAQRCLQEGTVGRSRFILGSGCVVPRGTQKEMLQAVSAVARSFELAGNGPRTICS